MKFLYKSLSMSLLDSRLLDSTIKELVYFSILIDSHDFGHLLCHNMKDHFGLSFKDSDKPGFLKNVISLLFEKQILFNCFLFDIEQVFILSSMAIKRIKLKMFKLTFKRRGCI